MAQVQPKNEQHWHDALIRYMQENPAASKSEMARHFKRSVSWLSIVINSDLFQVKYKERNNELNLVHDVTLTDRLESVAEAGLAEMERRIVHEPLVQPMKDVTASTSLALKALGYGAPTPQGANVVNNNNVLVVSKGDLDAAREKIHARRHEHEAPLIEQKPGPVAVTAGPGGGERDCVPAVAAPAVDFLEELAHESEDRQYEMLTPTTAQSGEDSN